MSRLGWLDYLLASLPFIPYWKTALKNLVSHVPALCLGVVAFMLSKNPLEGGAAMRAMDKKIDWVDYLTAHPFFIPLWVWAFLYIFMTFSQIGFVGVAFSLLFVALWLRLYLASAIRLCEYYAVQEHHPAPTALLAGAKP